MERDLAVIEGLIFSQEKGPRSVALLAEVEEDAVTYHAHEITLVEGETLSFEAGFVWLADGRVRFSPVD